MSEAMIVRKGGGESTDFSGATGSAAQLLSGYKMFNNNGELVTGSMINRGSVSSTINPGGSYSLSSGYYSGGTIRANSANYSGATGAAAQLVSGYKMWNNTGGLVSGSMTNRGWLSKSLNKSETYTLPAGYYSGGSISVNISKKYKTEILRGNIEWEVPSGLINNTISVMIFGGGDAGYRGDLGRYGGRGGSMNNAVFTNITPGNKYQINIGRGGTYVYNNFNYGGTTIFGSLLSANGGTGSGGYQSTYGVTQFGGGSASGGNFEYGGNGGTYGGGGGCGYCGWYGTGGNGGTYGGGGGGGPHLCYNIYKSGEYRGGHGGMYGGGGGGGAGYRSSGSADSDWGVGGNGGTYGGNGGNGGISSRYRGIHNATPGNNGTNTSTWTNVYYDNENKVYFRGSGLGKGQYYNFTSNGNVYGGGGGGGYGGNGGNPGWVKSDPGNSEDDRVYASGGGGGGYGSNGGNGGSAGGGGGGGFGGDGGDNCGGGGGYGKTAKGGSNCGGGGGYYAPGGNLYGGGGGYGPNGSGGSYGVNNGDGGIAGGGASEGNGGDGICIIQYYVYE